MNQADLNRAVAAATGETVETIARQGFGVMEMPQVDRDPLVLIGMPAMHAYSERHSNNRRPNFELAAQHEVNGLPSGGPLTFF